MKKIIVASLLAIFASVSFAQTNSTSNSNTSSDSAASNNGNTQAVVFTSPADSTTHVEYSGSQTVKNVPSMGAPSLTTSNDTCMGSSSASAAAPGIGLSFGSTWTDTNCVMLKNSRELWNMGMKGASLALMCNDKTNREALEITGYLCPQTEKAQNAQRARVNPTGPDLSDPFIAARNPTPAK